MDSFFAEFIDRVVFSVDRVRAAFDAYFIYLFAFIFYFICMCLHVHC